MTKEELIDELYKNQIIDIWEANLLSEPTFIIASIPAPDYHTNTTGDFRVLRYQLN